MLFDNNIIKIFFKDNIIKKFNILEFIPNSNIIYYNNSHLNYIYKHKINNIEYIFYGFFKDEYFVIIYDTYNEELETNIQNKYVYLIKLDWILKKINAELTLWVLDNIKINNKNKDLYVLTCRKKLFSENVSIQDLLKINNYDTHKVKIKIIKDVNDNNKILTKILSLIKFI